MRLFDVKWILVIIVVQRPICPLNATIAMTSSAQSIGCPENHRCVKLHLIRAKRFGESRVVREKGIGRKDSIIKKLGNKLKK